MRTVLTENKCEKQLLVNSFDIATTCFRGLCELKIRRVLPWERYHCPLRNVACYNSTCGLIVNSASKKSIALFAII